MKKYYHNLDDFENWEKHYDYVRKNAPITQGIQSALNIVEEYHNEKRFLYEGIYNRHPLRVARIIIEEFNIHEESTIICALLHDIIEWSNFPEKKIQELFGEEIYFGVELLTHSFGNWKDFVQKIQSDGNDQLVCLKIADKLDNNRGIFFSNNDAEKQKAIKKTKESIIILAEKYYPNILEELYSSIERLT